jgi:hypothetical protein
MPRDRQDLARLRMSIASAAARMDYRKTLLMGNMIYQRCEFK